MARDVMSAWFVVAAPKDDYGDWEYVAGPFQTDQDARDWINKNGFNPSRVWEVEQVRIAIYGM